MEAKKRSFGKQITAITAIAFFLIPGVMAVNVTYETIIESYDSILKIEVTESTITVLTEGADATYPRDPGFNYTHAFKIERVINQTAYQYNTVPGEVVCPDINLTCPDPQVDIDQSVFALEDFLEDHVIPERDELLQCADDRQECLEDLAELKGNVSVLAGRVTTAQSQADLWREESQNINEKLIPHYIIEVMLIVIIVFIFYMKASEGENPLGNVFKRKPPGGLYG